jgi:hypothetical protein
MTYGIVLLIHILLAVTAGALILYILAAVSLNHSSSYTFLAKILAAATSAQIVSGTVLAVMSPTLTAASLSAHIFLFLSICGAVEGLLMYKMRMHAFPMFNVAYSLCLSVFAFGLVVTLGF